MNCRSLWFAFSLVPSLALGQSDNDFEADVGASVSGMPGMNVNIRVKDGARGPGPQVAAHEEQSGEGFRISWDTDPEGGTWFKVLSPEGYPVTVLDDINFPKVTGTVPVSFRASGKRFYQVEIRTPTATFSKKFEAKSGMVAQLWVGAPTAPVQQVVIAQPVAVGPCGPESDLQQVSSAIGEESFSAGKLRVLEDAAQARGFCVEHTVRLLKLFEFENDKLSALKVLAPRLTDRQNNFKIYQAFTFDSGRDEAKKLLH